MNEAETSFRVGRILLRDDEQRLAPIRCDALLALGVDAHRADTLIERRHRAETLVTSGEPCRRGFIA